MAGLSVGAGTGATLAIAGATTTAIVISGFNFLKIGTLNMSASCLVSPFTLNSLTLSGSVDMFGTSASALFAFDRQSGTLAYSSQIDRVDLQTLLTSLTGQSINLGA